MAILSLKVRIADKGVVKTMQFEPSTMVYDACKIIREKMPEANLGQPKDFGLFLADDDPKKGVWMENGRSLEYYLIHNGDLLEYKKKIRTLRVRMLDGAVKTLLVDDSQPVGQLMVVICTRIGITNHDEYSMVRDVPQEPEKTATLKKEESKMGTLTLGRNKEKKMEQLRKQLHTDEELNWVDNSKTLREQGVDENECLLLRRKYFFSDQNIDARDPVQLNLLYVQCRSGILDGTHPVSQEEAMIFAGLQCQTQFGDYVETKHRPGFFDLKEFLPKEYLKVKGAEKRVLQEYRKCQGLGELDAKVKYTQLCRSLKTYGVTFFLVKEKMKGKNKLVPRLLGVNKDCVLRVDEKTKEVLRIWPLEQVRRWAASPNTFTLDFGDYQDSYYSVQTTDGEKIAQLIAGYIDIILKKKKAKDHLGIDGDEGSTMLEDTVAPAKATLMSHGTIEKTFPEEANVALPAVLRSGVNGELPFGTGSLQKPQYGAFGGQILSSHMPPQGQQPRIYDTMSKAQRALIGTIEVSKKTMEKAEQDLATKAELPPLGDDAASKKWKETEMDVNRQKVTDHMAAMGAATAEMVQLTGAIPDEVDHTAVGAAISTISSNMPELTKGVRTVAALMDEDNQGESLLDAARKLCGAFSQLLTAVNPEAPSPGVKEVPPVPPPRKSIWTFVEKEERQQVLVVAGRVGDASHNMIQMMQVPTEDEKEFQDILVHLAKVVATSTAKVVLEAKFVSSKCEDQVLQDKVIHAATQCAFATSQLVACARVVAPTIESPACQEQLTEAAKKVAKAVEQLLKDAQFACKDERTTGNLSDAAAQVTKALQDLLAHIKEGPRARETQQEAELETIITSTDRLITYTGSANEMIRQAKVLAEATTHLVGHIRGEAEIQEDVDHHQRLMGAARRLADATSTMIDAAKSCATSPHEASHQMALRAAAENLRSATSEAAQDQLRRKAMLKLENAAKQCAASATQTIAAAHACDPSNRNYVSQQQLILRSQESAEHIPRVIAAVKQSQARPDDSLAQLELVRVSQDVLEPFTLLVSSSRSAAPTVEDPGASSNLNSTSRQLDQDLAELRMTITMARETSSTLEIDHVIYIIESLERDLTEYKEAASRGKLYPLPGESAEQSAQLMNANSKTVGSNVAQLLSATVQNDEQYVGLCARDTADALRQMVGSVRGVASTHTEAPKEKLLDAARDVCDKTNRLMQEVKFCLQHPDDPSNQQRLTQVAKAVTFSLNSCVNCLPGQQDIDTAIHTITVTHQSISMERLPPTVRGFTEVQDDFIRLAGHLNDATNRVVNAMGGPPHLLAAAVAQYVHIFKQFIAVGLELAYLTQDPRERELMLDALRALCQQSMKFLQAIKQSAADPHAAHVKAQLAATSRAVTESINRLVDLCTHGAPWQKECDNALRKLQTARYMLQNPSEPASDAGYFACLDIVSDQSKSLGEGMTIVARSARESDFDSFCHSVRQISDSLCGMAEAAAQAAYLVGVADLSSVAGRSGLIDSNKFGRSVDAVREACERLRSTRVSHQEVLECATVIAKHTSALANMCRDASSRTPNPTAKKHFINCARDVASSTANVITTIKVLDAEFNDANRRHCADATGPLLTALDSLAAFANSPEFASVPARISVQGRQAQESITHPAVNMLDASCDMIVMAKSLALNPKDPPKWQSFSDQSKLVSNAIKQLVTAIRGKAPGQTECDIAVERLNALLRQLDQASLSALNQALAPRHDNSEQGFHEIMSTSAQQIIEKIEPTRHAAKREAENLGHRMTDLMNHFEPLSDSCIGAASLSYNSRRQMALLDQCKTVCECQLQLVYASKDSGGNPTAVQFHEGVDESAVALREAVGELLHTIGQAVSEAGVMSSMLDTISRAIAKTDEQVDVEGYSYVDCQTRMVRACKEIARIAQEMVSRSYTDVNELGALALDLSRNYAQLADDSRGAVAAASGPDVAFRIRSSVQELGTACIELVKNAGAVRSQPSDNYAKRDLSDSAHIVNEKVAYVLSALQAGSRGTQACINAASTVSGIIGDLDTTIMFATAGTLNPEREGEVFLDHREAILKTAKALVEDTKALVSGAASSQEQLAVAAQNAVRTIIQLSDVVKAGAAALTSNNSESQVLVINAVKDVAAALANLIQATKNASGKSFNDPAMAYLKEAAKVMVTNVTSLLKTVRAVEDEHQRGTRALEAAIEAIAQEIRAYDADDQAARPGNAEDLLRVTKPLTDATAKAVAAGQSCLQDDTIVAANMSRKAVYDLLSAAKSASALAENAEIKFKTLDAGRDVAIKVRELLQTLHMVLQKPTHEGKQLLLPASKSIAQAVLELVGYAEILKGSDWVDPSDPTVIAENELLGAASSIEAAARKLAQLRPRSSAREADETLNFDEQILEAAKSIAAAVSALVKAASAAQRELVSQGRVDPRPKVASEDYQWSEGLVSAARMVAAATHQLCEAANALVQGLATEEKLISAAKQVAAGTAQLIVACKVKADMSSKTMQRLQVAGNAVKVATDHLVRAAKQAIEAEDERTLVISQRMVSGIAQVLDAQEEVLRKERELDEARVKLSAIRKAKYRDHPAGSSHEASPEPPNYYSDF